MSPSSPQLKFPGLRAALKMIMKICSKTDNSLKILPELPMLSFTSHSKVRCKCQSCSSCLSCFFSHPCILGLSCLLCLFRVSFSSTFAISILCYLIKAEMKLGQKSEIWKNLTNLAKMIFQNHGTAWLVFRLC